MTLLLVINRNKELTKEQLFYFSVILLIYDNGQMNPFTIIIVYTYSSCFKNRSCSIELCKVHVLQWRFIY